LNIARLTFTLRYLIRWPSLADHFFVVTPHAIAAALERVAAHTPTPRPYGNVIVGQSQIIR
jgi:hypothetical protein